MSKHRGKRKLMLLLIILLMVPFLIWRLTQYFEQLIVREEMDKMIIIAENNMSNIQYYFESKLEEMDMLFDDEEISEQRLNSLIEKYSTEQETMRVVDTSGSEMAAASIDSWELLDSDYRLHIDKPLNDKTVRLSIALSSVYEEYLAQISLGKNGYCAMKDEQGVLVMHPAASQIGLNSKEGRLQQYPDLDPDSVNSLLYNQYHNDSGCQIVNSYWWDRPEAGRAKKLISYASVMIDGHRFVGTNVMDYNEVVKPIKSFILYSTLLTLFLIIVFSSLLFSWFSERRIREQLKQQLQYAEELAKMNEKFRLQETQLQKYDKLQTLGVLSTAIAHEYNNLLTPALIYSEMLEAETLNAQQREILNNLKTSILSCGELSSQLKDYARQEETLQEEALNLTEVVQSGLQLIERLKPKRVLLKASIPNEPIRIQGNRRAINQILMNLMNNAYQAIEQKGYVLLTLSTEENQAVLCIEDNGKGIAADILNKVYDPFFTTKNEWEGTGLGLSVVKKLIARMGGTIHCESETGQGTRFTVYLPLL